MHRATLIGGEHVAMKVQYPGVADSIESDLSNLHRIVTLTNLLPPGLFVDRMVEVAKDELVQECNYELEVGVAFLLVCFFLSTLSLIYNTIQYTLGAGSTSGAIRFTYFKRSRAE